MLTITIDGLKDMDRRVLDDVESMIILYRTGDGAAGKAVCGSMSIEDAVVMMKALTAGKDHCVKMIRMAKAMADLIPEVNDEDVLDMTDMYDEKKNPFAAFMKGMKK